MRKTYVAPLMESELFETPDVITVSVTFNTGNYNAGTQQDEGVPVVDAATETYN